MKKFRVALLLLALVLVLSACAQKQTVFEIEKNGVAYTVNTEKNTVFDGAYSYRYTSIGSPATVITVYYPNDSSYTETIGYSGNATTFGASWSDDYEEYRYVPGSTLVELVRQAENQAEAQYAPDGLRIALGMFILAAGGVNIAFPGLMWQLRYGLFVRDAEPTDLARGVARVCGAVLAVVGVIWIIIGITGR